MGVAISSQSQLAPISLASTIIGFISFAFTLATLLRVFWNELQTFSAAKSEIEDHLTNLKQSLYEERSTLKRARRIHQRRRQSAHTDAKERERESALDVAFRAMQRTNKHAIQQFIILERPFLEYPDAERRKSSDKYDEAYYGYSSGDGTKDLEVAEYSMAGYKKCGFRERLHWVHKKETVTSMTKAQSLMTIRRMSLQFNGFSYNMRDFGMNFNDIDDRLYEIEDRLHRVVGVQRIA
ncbi:hypothetical protein BT63DRAFT_100634 [Microthyrium microscopicum]|uniref:Uncharacterized protein n=1 Tax=Microthyrium microscopicum TaxID=703497 RepID=A0A6A6TVI0_9PEZI|nr:hypothetical protein BT63DRAFT_100634 [Microthyrium microscopicum]